MFKCFYFGHRGVSTLKGSRARRVLEEKPPSNGHSFQTKVPGLKNKTKLLGNKIMKSKTSQSFCCT